MAKKTQRRRDRKRDENIVGSADHIGGGERANDIGQGEGKGGARERCKRKVMINVGNSPDCPARGKKSLSR